MRLESGANGEFLAEHTSRKNGHKCRAGWSEEGFTGWGLSGLARWRRAGLREAGSDGETAICSSFSSTP